jgi:hypothetical protein
VRLQGRGIRQLVPGFEVTFPGRRLVARGTLHPSAITRAYRVRIEYREGEPPDVYVEEPMLSRRQLAPDKAIPHTYDSDKPGKERPCCFYPAADWDGTHLIATTVVPWLMSWLFDYEIWHATGDWYGGGVHPNMRGAAKRLKKGSPEK